MGPSHERCPSDDKNRLGNSHTDRHTNTQPHINTRTRSGSQLETLISTLWTAYSDAERFSTYHNSLSWLQARTDNVSAKCDVRFS